MLGGLAAGAVVLATGCTSAGQDTRAPRGIATRRQVSPDVALATTAAGRVGQVADLVERTVARHRQLRHRLAGLAALHAAHLRLLQEAVPADRRRDEQGPHREHVPHAEHAALRSVLRAEHSLRPQLQGLAMRAESGEFARLLAAMSAAVGQQLAVVTR